MKVSDITLTSLQISGNEKGDGRLISQKPYYEYVDGKKTENQIGIKYDAVFPDNLFEKTAVKVASKQAVITDEQLKKNSGKIQVRFTNLSGRFYRTSSGDYALSCKADGIEVIS